jgi:IS4 transposase
MREETAMRDNEMVLVFEREKETKNTVRFQEIPDKGQPPRVGTLYVQKWAVGNAAKLTVTITVEE